MGHMDSDEDKHSVRVFTTSYEQTFHGCTEVEANENELSFTDGSGKRHRFYGVGYEITKD